MRCDRCRGTGLVMKKVQVTRTAHRWETQPCDCHGGHRHCCDGEDHLGGSDVTERELDERTDT